jgi:hypothetical protein
MMSHIGLRFTNGCAFVLCMVVSTAAMAIEMLELAEKEIAAAAAYAESNAR